jgi:hypothetical protein
MRLPGCARTHSSSGLTHRSSWIGRVCVALIHSSASTTSQYPNSGTFGGGDIFDELGTCAAGRSLHIPTGTVLKRIPPTTPINRMTLSRIPSFFHCAICIIHLLEHDLVLFICLHDFLVSFLGPTVTAFWARANDRRISRSAERAQRAERCRLNARVSRPAWPESRPQRPETGLAARRPFSGPERSFFGPANDRRISRSAERAQRSGALSAECAG